MLDLRLFAVAVQNFHDARNFRFVFRSIQQLCVEPLSDLGHSEVGVLAFDEQLPELLEVMGKRDLCEDKILQHSTKDALQGGR